MEGNTMIVNNQWFPYSTNMRSLRWEREGMRLPFTDAVQMMALLGGIPAFMLISAKAGIHPTSNLTLAAASVAAFCVCERANPLQKYTGVPLDGVMLSVLQSFLDKPLEELAKNRTAHEIVDRYIENDIVRDCAVTITLNPQGVRSDDLPYLRSFSCLRHEARLAAGQIFGLRVPASA